MHTVGALSTLAELYVGDERFKVSYDKVAPGLAQCVRDAVVANADAGS